MKDGKFSEFMSEQRNVDRWFVMKIALYGGFCGALLAVSVMVFFGLSWP